MKCSNCSFNNFKKSIFCQECGYKLTGNFQTENPKEVIYKPPIKPDKRETRKIKPFKRLRIFLGILLLFIVIYVFFIRFSRIDGNSMSPHFLSGQKYLTINMIYKFNDPKRGDVIIFNGPETEYKDLISRVVALPGDRISIKDGRFYVDGQTLKEPYLALDVITYAGEFLKDGEEKNIPADNYFVMGDNRTHANDSRSLGFIRKADIKSKVTLCYWDCNPIQTSNSGNLQTEPNPKQIQEYYDTYKNPYVIYIRKALDSYLAGNNQGINDIAIKSDTIHSDQSGDSLSGLDSFSKDYYKSKFIVVNFAAGIGGGKIISIEFQDKPDKVFDVWIYQLAGGDYEMRGFGENKILSGEKLIELNKTFKTFLEDKGHSL